MSNLPASIKDWEGASHLRSNRPKTAMATACSALRSLMKGLPERDVAALELKLRMVDVLVPAAALSVLVAAAALEKRSLETAVKDIGTHMPHLFGATGDGVG